MKRVNIKEIEQVAFSFAKKFFSYHEPIPDFTTRFPNILESCVSVPFQSFAGKSKYNGLIEKGAILFYLIIKNHPFQNGNKRIAMATLLFFLNKNGKWIKVNPKSLYNFAIWVAESPSDLKDSVVKGIGDFLEKYIIDLE